MIRSVARLFPQICRSPRTEMVARRASVTSRDSMAVESMIELQVVE